MRNVILVIMVILAGASLVQGDTEWTSGHHEIVDGDVYGEIYIYNDVTLDIWGGDIYRLATYNTTVTDWFGGEMDTLWTRDDSIVNIYGGDLGILSPTDDSSVYLYAYNVIYHPTGGYYDYGWIEGTYISNDLYFAFDFARPDTYSHIVIVSELVVGAEIDIQPKTLSLRSKGKWISCKMWLPEDYNVADVNSASVLLEGEVSPEWIWFNEGQNAVMAKFARSELVEILEPGEVELTVTGYLTDGSYFKGTDTVKVIGKGRRKD